MNNSLILSDLKLSPASTDPQAKLSFPHIASWEGFSLSAINANLGCRFEEGEHVSLLVNKKEVEEEATRLGENQLGSEDLRNRLIFMVHSPAFSFQNFRSQSQDRGKILPFHTRGF